MLLPILFQIILSYKECGIVGCVTCDSTVNPNLCNECDTKSYFQNLNGIPSTKCSCQDGWDFLFGQECQVPSPLISVTLGTENNVKPKVGVKCIVTDINPDTAIRRVNYEWYRVKNKNTETKIDMESKTSSEYTIVGDDVGYKIKVTAIGNVSKGFIRSESSTLQDMVTTSLTSITLATENNVKPRVGIKCQVTNIQPSYADGKINYQWYRIDDQNTETLITVEDSSSKEYKLDIDDVGYKIKVKATGIESEGCNGDATSTLSSTILASLTSITLVTENDANPKVGIKCQVTNIQPSDADGKINYQWYRVDDQNTETLITVEDSSSKEYKLDVDDVGYKIKVKATGIESEGYAGDATSILSAVVLDLVCPVGCHCDSNSEECKSCKSDEHFVEKSGADPKECECDSNNGYAFGSGIDSTKCVCDSTKHLISGTDENSGNCVCEPGYKGDIINGCQLDKCAVFDQNCNQCDNNDNPQKCTQCKSNEYGVSDSTHKCVLCKEVTKDNNCKTCQLNDDDKYKCLSCIEGQINGDSCTLIACITKNCATCTQDGATCLTCKQGFVLTSTKQCQSQNPVTCKDVVENCKTCEQKDGEETSICNECNEGYALVEGLCIPKQCPNGCICDKNKFVCERCQPGYKEKKNNNNVIISCDPDFTACNPELKINGCMYCQNKKPFNKCVLCNSNDNHINLEPNEDGICTCNNGYVFENNKCVPEKADCTVSIPGCSKCFKDNTQSCAVCNEENGYNSLPIESLDGNNICSCKVHGFKPNDKSVCAVPDENKCNVAIPGCLICKTPEKCDICDETKLFKSNNVDGKCQCIEGYEINSQGICNKPATSECNTNIIGCLKCGTNKNKCLYCDQESNFVLDEEGKCLCDDGFELNKDGQCIESLKPAEIITGQSIPLSSDFIHEDPSNSNNLILNTTDMKVNSPFALHYNQIENSINSISIEENQYDNIYMLLPKKSDLTITKKTEEAKCNFMLPMEESSSTTLNLMKESNGITILNYIGNNILNLKSSEQGTIKLANFSTRESIKVSPQNDVEFEYINIFENGKVENTAINNKKIYTKHITVQRGAKGILKGVEILEDLVVGPSSTTEFGDDVKYEGKTFNIKYSRTQAVGKSFFTGIFKEIPKEIKISKINSDLLLDDESNSEEMLIAQGSKDNFNHEICSNWAKIVSGEFGNTKCDESDSANNKVIAIKTNGNNNNKKKLNGGEIAGIVIACVVVVASIIALLVYFLVIKKKKDATNSTNGDSSLSV